MAFPHFPSHRYVSERKFVGELTDRPFVLGLLDAWLPADRHYGTGRINSVYFDTPGLRSWDEKANGDNLKSKVRARWYGCASDLGEQTPVFLELKRRIGSARIKTRVEIRVPTDLLLRTPFADSAWSVLLRENTEALAFPAGTDWSPVCLIEYDRIRYDDPENDSRVSVDWNISAIPNEERFPWATPCALRALVCEFKNRGGAPPRWSEALQNAGLRLRSFSKYGECMNHIVNGIP